MNNTKTTAADYDADCAKLGITSTNSLTVPGHEYHAQFNGSVDWTSKGLKITRLRLLSDPGYPAWDVSYCHGELSDGTKVNVVLPFSQLPKRNMKAFIINEAKRAGVYAKGLGILDDSVISKLC